MASWKKFKLSPGQQAPIGSLGIGLTDGYIAFYGDEISSPIESEEMTIDDLKAFKLRQLESDYNSFREGELSFSVIEIVDYLFMRLYLKNKINQNPPNEATLQAILDNLTPFFDWYQTVLKHKIDNIKLIKAGATISDVEAVSWDFAQFSATNPGTGMDL